LCPSETIVSYHDTYSKQALGHHTPAVCLLNMCSSYSSI